MSLIVREGNLIEDLKEGVLVHGCNCLGQMGAGFAKFLRDKYPAVYEHYRHRYREVGLYLGDAQALASPGTHRLVPELGALAEETQFAALPDGLVVVNAMTQAQTAKEGDPPERVYVDYDAISAAFVRVRMLAQTTKLGVHFPLIGAGLARGHWPTVQKRIERALGPQVEATLWILPGTTVPR